jgi:hypothetical protein
MKFNLFLILIFQPLPPLFPTQCHVAVGMLSRQHSYKLGHVPISFLTSPSYRHRHFICSPFLRASFSESPVSASMVASRPEMFKPSYIDESKILKLVDDHLIPPRAVLQWRLAKDEEILTPNTNEIVISKAFFQWGFGLPACDFFRGLLNHYKIELVHLNPNSILQITVFVHLCEAYLTILPNFFLFKHYFLLKYQPSAANYQVVGGVGIQARANRDFLALPLKTSLKGWHTEWFYCENHKPSLPPFVGRFPEYDVSWAEEPTDAEELAVQALVDRVSDLKQLGQTSWRGRELVGLLSHPIEASGSSRLGIQRDPGPHLRGQPPYHQGQTRKSLEGDVSEHRRVADSRTGARISHLQGSRPSKINVAPHLQVNLRVGLLVGEVRAKPPSHAGDGAAEPMLTVE